MTRLTILSLAAALAAAAAVPAGAQSLSERIAAVRKQNAEKEAAPGSMETRILQALLYEDVTVDFRGEPAVAVFEYLRTALGINIVVRSLDDPAGYGIDPATPITLKAEDMRALDVLELVLDQCEVGGEACTWQLRDSYLEVGTKERLAAPSARFTRTYPIDDLLYEAPRFTDSIQMGMVAPWQEAYRYGGGYRYGYGGGYYRGYGGYGPGYGGAGFSGSIQVNSGGGAGQSSVNDDEAKRRRAREIIELIVDTVETSGWAMNGGDWATIRYIDGALVVTAPDFIQRQINGYGRVPRPRPAATAEPRPGELR